MSIAVDPRDLGKALADFPYGYLLTTGTDRPGTKVVTVEPVVGEGVLRIADPGRGSLRNVAAQPAVTVIFPPRAHRGYTLIVDGAATVEGNDLVISASTAVLHRPAAHADGPPPPADSADGCGHDCTPLTQP